MYIIYRSCLSGNTENAQNNMLIFKEKSVKVVS